MTSITRADGGARGFAAVALVVSFALVAHAASAWEPMPAMASMPGMTTPGGATHATLWLPTHRASWSGTARAFVTMWSVMMIPMMLPSALPSLWRLRAEFERRAGADAEHMRVRALAAVVLAAASYFAVWSALGAAIFPVGAVVAAIFRRDPSLVPAVPTLTGAAIVACGTIQFSAWKARRLAACRRAHWRRSGTPTPIVGLRYGARLGVDCILSCANWTALLIVVGMMEPAAMVAVTGAITAERLSAGGHYVRQVTGGIAVAVAIVLLVRALVGACGTARPS